MGLKTCDVDYGTDGAKELEERLFPLWYCENGKANEVQEHQKGVWESQNSNDSSIHQLKDSNLQTRESTKNASSKERNRFFAGNLDSRVPKELLAELRARGTKFTENELEFVTRDTSGQIVWLAQGHSMAGMKHIMKHADQFQKAFGVSLQELPAFLQYVVSKGKILRCVTEELPNGHVKFTKTLRCNDQFVVVVGVGDNGFLVTAFPHRKE